jgi:hypothetical protein
MPDFATKMSAAINTFIIVAPLQREVDGWIKLKMLDRIIALSPGVIITF